MRLICFVFGLGVASVALAAPSELNHQGRLLDATGVPLQGTHTLTVTLYATKTGTADLWSESLSVSFDNGYFSIVLGENEALDDSLFGDDELWLALAVDNGPELGERFRVASVPFARHARVAGSVSGGSVDATEIRVNGTVVIDSGGSFVGTPTSGAIGALECDEDQVALYDGSAWTCADFVADALDEGGVLTAVTGAAIDLSDGSTVGGHAIATTDQLYTDDDVKTLLGTATDLNLNAATLLGGSAIATADQLYDDADVKEVLSQSDDLDLHADTTLAGLAIATTDQLYADADVKDVLSLSDDLDLHANTTLAGLAIATTDQLYADDDVKTLLWTATDLNLNSATQIGGAAIATTDQLYADADVKTLLSTATDLNLHSATLLGGSAIATTDQLYTDADVKNVLSLSDDLDLHADTTLGGLSIATTDQLYTDTDVKTLLSTATDLNLNSSTQLGGLSIATTDELYTDTDVKTVLSTATDLDLHANTTLGGETLVTTESAVAIRLADTSDDCDDSTAGTLRYGTRLELCTLGKWMPVRVGGDGLQQGTAAGTCQEIHVNYSESPSGAYWLDPNGGSHGDAFRTWCDMDRNGGGWTLVLQNNGPVISNGNLNYADSTTKTTVRGGSIDSGLSGFDILVGLGFWADIGTEGRYEVGSTAGTPVKQATFSSLTVNPSDKYRLSMTGPTLVMGDVLPGIYTSHNGMAWSASDADNDVYSGDCSNGYSHPWWYSACWSGSIWGSESGYTRNAYWTSSTTDYHSWGALWLR